MKRSKTKQYDPLAAFNKFCYAYLHNDWVTVIASLFAIAFSLALFTFSFFHRTLS